MIDGSLPRIDRRAFLAGLAASVAAPSMARGGPVADPLPPVRAITRGPKYHWFGYYDKLEFDPTGRYVLGMEVGFERRSPRPEDAISVGMVDLHDGDRWIELGESRAWCWQQGCMLQWLPGSKSEVIWNDREDGRFVSPDPRRLRHGTRRTIPSPIYARQPRRDAGPSRPTSAASTTRGPATDTRASPTPNRDVAGPRRLRGLAGRPARPGSPELMLSFRQVAATPLPRPEGGGTGPSTGSTTCWSSPDGTRFAFLHRWRRRGKPTRDPDDHRRRRTARTRASSTRTARPRITSGATRAHILAWACHPSHGEQVLPLRGPAPTGSRWSGPR